MTNYAPLFMLCFLSIISLGGFMLLSVRLWTGGRAREREAFFRTEILKKLTDAQVGGGTDVLRFAEIERVASIRRRKEELKLSGLITIALGTGLLIFLYEMLKTETRSPVYLVSAIPLLIGATIFVYSFTVKAA